MSSRLDRITDWAARVRAAGYDYETLVESCSSSRSQLRRCFLAKFGKPPQTWMDELRLADAANLLCTSKLNVKQIAANLNYKYPGNFARQFKACFGCSPSHYAAMYGNALDQDNRKMA